MTDHPLDRFITAQADSHDCALAEIRAGAKRSHWMWFIFPQLRGLGQSAMAQLYGIGSLAEARAYLAHPVLGHRLWTMVGALQALPPGCDAEDVFGPVDAMKLRSSLTLFAVAAPQDALFRDALDRWFGGAADPKTLDLLNRA